MKKSLKLVAMVLIFVIISASMAFAETKTIRYVKPNGTGDGSTWTAASNDLQAMITASASGDEVWVSGGTIKCVAASITRSSYFSLKDGVKVYGGFCGSEASIEDRNISENETILSAEIGDPDLITDNTYHVVRVDGLKNGATLDGFTLTGGYATVSQNFQSTGAGIFIYNSTNISLSNLKVINNTAASNGGGIGIRGSSAVIENVVAEDNICTNASNGFGGGVYIYDSSVVINNLMSARNSSYGGMGASISSSSDVFMENSTIKDNFPLGSTKGTGGGLDVASSSRVTLENVIVTGNSANDGGGIRAQNSQLAANNTTISENISTNTGGGIHSVNGTTALTNTVVNSNTSGNNGGGIYSSGSSTILKLINSTISGNSALSGGGMRNSRSSATIINTVVSGNSANFGGGIYNDGILKAINVTIGGNLSVQSGGGLYNESSSKLDVHNSVIAGNISTGTTSENLFAASGSNRTLSYSLLEGFNNIIDGNKNAAPEFVNPIDPSVQDWAPTTLGDYRLTAFSPAIDAGSNQTYLDAAGKNNFSEETDRLGNSRLIGSVIDMGAYEGASISTIESAQLVNPDTRFTMNMMKYSDNYLELTVSAAGTVTTENIQLYVADYSGNKLTSLIIPTAISDSEGIEFNFALPKSNTYKIMLFKDMTPLFDAVTTDTIWN